MSDQNNEFERDMLARELFMLFVQRWLKRDDVIEDLKKMPADSMAYCAYQGADAFLEAGKEVVNEDNESDAPGKRRTEIARAVDDTLERLREMIDPNDTGKVTPFQVYGAIDTLKWASKEATE